MSEHFDTWKALYDAAAEARAHRAATDNYYLCVSALTTLNTHCNPELQERIAEGASNMLRDRLRGIAQRVLDDLPTEDRERTERYARNVANHRLAHVVDRVLEAVDRAGWEGDLDADTLAIVGLAWPQTLEQLEAS
jgi:hypothetical protein